MFRFALSLLVLLVLALPLQAEVLLLDAITEEPPNSSAGLLRPERGESMQAVESRFGAPQSSAGPVGEPPISSWTYPGFTVYFEHDIVLRTVVHRP